jgi:hypothetical protein
MSDPEWGSLGDFCEHHDEPLGQLLACQEVVFCMEVVVWVL